MDFDPRDFDARDTDSREIHDLRDVFELPAGATTPWSSPSAAVSFWSGIAVPTRVTARCSTRTSNGRGSSNRFAGL